MKKDAFNRINALEDRSKTNMLQIQDMIEDNRSALMGHLERMDAKFSTMINKVTDGFSNVMVICQPAHVLTLCLLGTFPCFFAVC